MMLLTAPLVRAQDVIVKSDGSTILAKVLKVNPSDVEYKKFSNPNGPIYTINKSDLLSINYENGEKDVFSDVKDAQSRTDNAQSANSSFENDQLICNYNDRIVKNKLSKKSKQAKWVYRSLKVHPQSVIIAGRIRMFVNIDQIKNGTGDKAYFQIGIENNSDRMLYIDLENSTYRINRTANKYYVNSSTTTSSGSNVGASVNLGPIASLFGIGGAVGAVAPGVNVGGGRNSGTSTTVYADRIITVAPHSTYVLPKKSFYDSDFDKAYRTDFSYGDHFTFKQPNNIADTPWEFVVTYAEEGENTIKRFNLGLYISDELGIGSSWDEDVIVETRETPLHYLFKVKGGWLNKQ